MKKDKGQTQEKRNGITLVALVITIIVLLILAGITISLTIGQNGIITRAQDAGRNYLNAQDQELAGLNNFDRTVENIIEGTKNDSTGSTVVPVPLPTQITTEETLAIDDKGNTVVIPEGFKVVTSEATTVDKGIVIEDASGNQFVWIPVGEIIKADGTKETIEFNRYTFAADGTPTVHNDAIISSYFQELASSEKGNIVAKDIAGFKTSAVVNKGYYIGRYEARSATKRTAMMVDTATQITSKKSDYVYNYVTQPRAIEQARGMYNKDTFTSDLINSYAWDTAVVFIQKCGTNANYSNQKSLNTTFAEKGTDNDKQCNIYDMASNILEWSTETSSNSGYPCVARGGTYFDNGRISSGRYNYKATGSNDGIGFRTVLYL